MSNCVMLPQKHTRNCAGFSLVEMAIVMCVIAVLAGGALVISSAQQEKNKYALTNQRIDAIVEAMKRQGFASGYLACPAPLNALESATNFGVATDCSAPLVSGVTYPTAYDVKIRIGAVPVRSLNLPKEMEYDGWGNRFTYFVIEDLAKAESTSLANFFSSSALNSGIIQVLDNVNNVMSMPASPLSYLGNGTVSFAVISHGRDGKGATNRKGVVVNACAPTVAGDGENCNNDAILKDMRIFDGSGAGAQYFDDVIRWVPLYIFQ